MTPENDKHDREAAPRENAPENTPAAPSAQPEGNTSGGQDAPPTRP